MDFLSRLIGGVGAAQGRRSSANNPQQRLARFKKTYSQVLQAWNKATPTKLDSATTDSIRLSLQRLTTLLHDDTRAPAPHLCLSFAASSQIYITIARIALSLNNEDIVRETVAIFSALVDNDEENLLGTGRFAKGLMTFVDRVLKPSSLTIGSQTQGEILELIFGIAAKIRLDPDLLPVWFRPRSTDQFADGQAETEQLQTDHKDFPLCYQFIGHVYHEGRAGDFARTGLLYIFESASNSVQLEDWLIESDLPTLMASGLGALYSQLQRKLTIAHSSADMPLILALSDDDKPPSNEIENFHSEDLQTSLTTFMSNLVFWQDILDHCRSVEIRKTLIDHFHIFFLQQILYPSMLESSDIDGGSSVAVLTYLWRILDSVDHPDLINLILRYLLAIPGLEEDQDSRPSTARSMASNKRKKSLLALSQAGGASDGLSPSLFNLVDLVHSSIQSKDGETNTAALRLVTVLIHKHHSIATSTMIKTIPFRPHLHGRTVGILSFELEMYLGHASRIGGTEGLDDSFNGCLKDALAAVESHICSIKYLGMQGPSTGDSHKRGAFHNDRGRAMETHCLLTEDPLIQGMMGLLRTFFTNNIETNLELTNALSQLASCPYTRLEGWIATDPISPLTDVESPTISDRAVDKAGIDLDDFEELELERIKAYKNAGKKPGQATKMTPVVAEILEMLGSQLEVIRADIPQLDHYVAGRKRAFQGATEFEDPYRPPLPSITSPRISTEMSREGSRNGISTPLGSPTRLIPATPEPLQIPRGRQAQSTSRNTASLGLSPRMNSPQGQSRSSSRRSNRLASPSKAARTMSPLKQSLNVEDIDRESASIRSKSQTRSADEEIFEKIIHIPPREQTSDAKESDHGQDLLSDTKSNNHATGSTASFNHILTNIVILQEFILELTAILQVRASLLQGEIRFV